MVNFPEGKVNLIITHHEQGDALELFFSNDLLSKFQNLNYPNSIAAPVWQLRHNWTWGMDWTSPS